MMTNKFETVRNETFMKIYPVVSNGVYSMIEILYPNFAKKHKEDIIDEIKITLLEQMDIFQKIVRNKPTDNKVIDTIIRNDSIDSFIIGSVFSLVEKKVREECDKQSLNLSFEKAFKKYESLIDQPRRIRNEFFVISYTEEDDKERYNSLLNYIYDSMENFFNINPVIEISSLNDFFVKIMMK